MTAIPMVNCGFFSNSAAELLGGDTTALPATITLVDPAAEGLYVPSNLGISKVEKFSNPVSSQGYNSPAISRAAALVRTGVVFLFWPGVNPNANTYEEIMWIDDGPFNGYGLVWNKDDLSLGFRDFAGVDKGRCTTAKPTVADTYGGLIIPWELHLICDKKAQTHEIQARKWDPTLGSAPIIETKTIAAAVMGTTTYLRFGRVAGAGAKANFYLGHVHAWEGMPATDYGPVGVGMGVGRPTSQITNSSEYIGHDSGGDKADSTTAEWQWLDDATADDSDYVVYRGTNIALGQRYQPQTGVVPAGAKVLGYTIRGRGYGTLGTALLVMTARVSSIIDISPSATMVATKYVYDAILCRDGKPVTGFPQANTGPWPVSAAINTAGTNLTGAAGDNVALNAAIGMTISCDGCTLVVTGNTAGPSPVYTGAAWVDGTPTAGAPYMLTKYFADGPSEADLLQVGHSGTAGTVGNDIRTTQEFITWMWQPVQSVAIAPAPLSLSLFLPTPIIRPAARVRDLPVLVRSPIPDTGKRATRLTG